MPRTSNQSNFTLSLDPGAQHKQPFLAAATDPPSAVVPKTLSMLVVILPPADQTTADAPSEEAHDAHAAPYEALSGKQCVMHNPLRPSNFTYNTPSSLLPQRPHATYAAAYRKSSRACIGSTLHVASKSRISNLEAVTRYEIDAIPSAMAYLPASFYEAFSV